jgi:ATP-dependent protease ClpP protease subunit
MATIVEPKQEMSSPRNFRRKAPCAVVAMLSVLVLTNTCVAGPPTDPSQAVDDRAREMFPGEFPEGSPIDPGALADSLLHRDAKRRIEQHDATGVRVNAAGTRAPATEGSALPPSAYGEPVDDIKARERKRASGPGKVKGRIDCQTFSPDCLVKDLALAGTIDDSMLARLTQLIDEFHRRSDPINQPSGHTQIKLNSAGGSVAAAIAIGRLLRANRMEAVLDNFSVCVSACVLVYAGAVARLGNLGQIGIHQPYLDIPAQAKLDPRTAKNSYETMLRDVRAYLREMNVSEQLADEMLKVPSTSVRYLSADEQDQFGLVMTDPVESELMDIEQAQELGISRAELMRRQTLAMKECYARDMSSPTSNCYDAVMKTGIVPNP